MEEREESLVKGKPESFFYLTAGSESIRHKEEYLRASCFIGSHFLMMAQDVMTILRLVHQSTRLARK